MPEERKAWAHQNLIRTLTIVSYMYYAEWVTLQIDVSFSCVCPVTDHEFSHNIVKVAVDPWANSLLWQCYEIYGQ